MAEFLKLNGIAVPVLIDGAEHEPQLLMDSARAESMALIENVEAEKGFWRLRLQPQTRANAFAFRQLINGAGHYWSFDDTAGGGGTAGLYSSRALGPTGAITGVTLGTATPSPWLGAGRVQITAGNTLVYTLGAGLPGITVMAAVNVNAAGWNHKIKDDGGTVYTDGVLTGAAAMISITLATGVVTLSAPAVAHQFDELIILPYRLPSTWPAQAYAQQNPGGGNTQWSLLRQLKVQGDVLPEGGTKVAHGRVTKEGIAPYVIDAVFQPSARELEFELVEV